MTFEETLHYLHELGESRMRLDLEPTQKLLDLLGRPDRSLRSVVVSGTNGKGSTCAFLTAIAKASGKRVGTYTSPHLTSPVERIAIDGVPVDEATFAEVTSELAALIARTNFGTITYFEFLTILAVLIFQRIGVDLAIFEVGLGGRLDTTNALERVGTITTTIDYDHTAILGTTLAEIAREKIAIVRESLPAVVGEQPLEAREKIFDFVAALGARRIYLGTEFHGLGGWKTFRYRSTAYEVGPIELSLRGDHQVGNAACAVAMARELGLNAIEEGLRSAVHPARLERFMVRGKEVWLDVAHNPAAARRLTEFFRSEKLAPVDLVIGVLGDKDWKGITEALLPISKSVTLCKPNSSRAWEPALVRSELGLVMNLPVCVVETPVNAFREVVERSERVLCTGSFYVVGEIRRELA
ncbi:MAG: folylpolyglutamate synthase/dihydrofolate synthase family protein [Pseudomonadota bacterium]